MANVPQDFFFQRRGSNQPSFVRAAEKPRLFSPMRTAGPAARTALAFSELCTHALDMLFSCFGLFHGDGPADPFITRERRNVFPCGERGLVGGKGFPQIRRNLVYAAAGDCFFSRMFFRLHSTGMIAGAQTENQKSGWK